MSKDIPVIHSSVVPSDQESGQATFVYSDTEIWNDQGQSTRIHGHYESYSKLYSYKYECKDETRRFCRVCWDVKEDADTLVSPCCCSGTQKYVHKSCLREWQKTVLRSNLGDDRAFRCGVCKSLYTISPMMNRWKSNSLKAYMMIMIFVSLVSIYYCGIVLHAWPMVAMIIVFVPILSSLRGPNKSFILMLLVSTVAFVLVILGWSHMYKLVRQNKIINGNGYESFSPASLRPGILLLAKKGVRGSVFANSVVFIFSHSKTGGSKGVILNQRILPRPDSFEINCHESPSEDQTTACKYNDYEFINHLGREGPLHFFGGPVYTLDRVVTLHPFESVRGCRAISLIESNEVIYLGGLLSDVLREGNQTRNADYPIWIFHGFSAWARGQLESEIQAGVWAVRQATYHDLIYIREANDIL